MRKPSKCRSCNINYSLTGKAGKHELKDSKFICILCNYFGKSIFHGEHEELSGVSFECHKCNNYIIYYDNDSSLYKDEIYLDDICIIRDYEDKETLVLGSRRTIYKYNSILEISSLEKLQNQIEILTTFS